MSDEDTLPEDLIPGDNDSQGPPVTPATPPLPDGPDNLTKIPASGGDVPIVLEPDLK